MFSVNQKRQIAEAIQQILRDTEHPELPAGEIQFHLHVEGANSWSWADIRNNGAVKSLGINPWNESQAINCRAANTTNENNRTMTEQQQHPHIQVSSDACATIATTRHGSTIPIEYRLVTKDDGNGGTAYALQGYFTWTEGWNKRGGEWRDLETQDQTTADDSVPFGPLL